MYGILSWQFFSFSILKMFNCLQNFFSYAKMRILNMHQTFTIVIILFYMESVCFPLAAFMIVIFTSFHSSAATWEFFVLLSAINFRRPSAIFFLTIVFLFHSILFHLLELQLNICYILYLLRIFYLYFFSFDLSSDSLFSLKLFLIC